MPRGVPRTNDAKNHAVIRQHTIDTQDQETGQSNARLMKSTGDASDALESTIFLSNTDRPVDMEKLAILAFMEEMITIRMATTTDKNAAQVFDLQVNSQYAFFRRGETKTLKRYFVDRLCRLKQTIYTQKEVINSEGIKDILNVPHTALLYDFSVVRDDNPRGADWLAHVQAEAG